MAFLVKAQLIVHSGKVVFRRRCSSIIVVKPPRLALQQKICFFSCFVDAPVSRVPLKAFGEISRILQLQNEFVEEFANPWKEDREASNKTNNK